GAEGVRRPRAGRLRARRQTLPAVRGADPPSVAGRRWPNRVLVRSMPALGRARPLVRVGHKGADLIAPGNTLASFDAAQAAGVEMIEFDVLSERADGTGELLVAHDYKHLGRHRPPTLTEVLAHLASERFAGVSFDAYLKLPA